MSAVMFSVDDVAAKIRAGKRLWLGGDEQLLRQLPAGDWVGGTIPYFIAENGGLFSRDRIYVTELPSYALGASIKEYDETSIAKIYTDMPSNGFSFVIIPASSRTHLSFAINAPHFPGFATHPLVGWISGVDLADLGKTTPKVFNGQKAALTETNAVVMHVSLPSSKVADIGILNIFESGQGDVLEFLEDGFKVTDVMVNGAKRNFADYLSEKRLDTKLPLVADLFGVKINISFQGVEAARKEVTLYAPVFKGIRYKHAALAGDYVKEFLAQLPRSAEGECVFSCNCILNYLYSNLEGKKTGAMTGPVTFGEVAYQLLNQTMVYLKVVEVGQQS
jgi:hypothetical protein